MKTGKREMARGLSTNKRYNGVSLLFVTTLGMGIHPRMVMVVVINKVTGMVGIVRITTVINQRYGYGCGRESYFHCY